MRTKQMRIIIAIIVVVAVIAALIPIVISKIDKKELKKEGTVANINYLIGEQNNTCYSYEDKLSYDYEKKGYYTHKSNKVVYYIMLGQKSTDGYKIKVRSIKKKNNGLVITIKEITPKETAATWITCPNINITFDKDPGEVIIKDTKGKKLKKLK